MKINIKVVGDYELIGNVEADFLPEKGQFIYYKGRDYEVEVVNTTNHLQNKKLSQITTVYLKLKPEDWDEDY